MPKCGVSVSYDLGWVQYNIISWSQMFYNLVIVTLMSLKIGFGEGCGYLWSDAYGIKEMKSSLKKKKTTGVGEIFTWVQLK